MTTSHSIQQHSHDTQNDGTELTCFSRQSSFLSLSSESASNYSLESNRHVTKNVHRKDTTREIDVLLISSKEDRNARWSDSFANVEREDDAMLRSERIQCTVQSGQFRFIQKHTQTNHTLPTR